MVLTGPPARTSPAPGPRKDPSPPLELLRLGRVVRFDQHIHGLLVIRIVFVFQCDRFACR
jgi:hypothetical protein